jgi:hypothetical protein
VSAISAELNVLVPSDIVPRNVWFTMDTGELVIGKWVGGSLFLEIR